MEKPQKLFATKSNQSVLLTQFCVCKLREQVLIYKGRNPPQRCQYYNLVKLHSPRFLKVTCLRRHVRSLYFRRRFTYFHKGRCTGWCRWRLRLKFKVQFGYRRVTDKKIK